MRAMITHVGQQRSCTGHCMVPRSPEQLFFVVSFYEDDMLPLNGGVGTACDLLSTTVLIWKTSAKNLSATLLYNN
jgi:hypothetical protein